MTSPTCASCRFFRRREVGKALGQCHSRAPVVMFCGMAIDPRTGGLAISPVTGQQVPNIDTFFPAVPDTEWCGDHSPRSVKDLDLSKLEREELEGQA